MQPEAGPDHAEGADDGAAHAVDRGRYGGDAFLHRIGAHGRAIGIECAAERGTDRGVV